MQTSTKSSQSSLRWFYIFLFLIERMKKQENHLHARLNNLSKEIIEKASRSTRCKRAAIILVEKIRSGKKFSKSDFKFIDLIVSESTKEHLRIHFLKSSDNYEGVIDDDFIRGLSPKTEKIEVSLDSGMGMIRMVHKGWYKKASEVLEMASGLFDKRNVINSGFTKDIPGFISFNINCDPAIIGEQIAHETTHLMFDNLLFFDDKARSFIRSIPPVYSIFAKKPRTIELVVHGLFSYTSVYLYWDYLSKKDSSYRKTALTRKKQVAEHIRQAVMNLDNVMSPDMWKRLKRIYKNICPLDPGDLWSTRSKRKISRQRILKSASEFLSPVETAELVLAIEGNKVSRISKELDNLGALVQFLNKIPVYYCFSNHLFGSSADENINDFKNVITSVEDLDSNNTGNLCVHIYLSHEKALLKKAFLLDQEDKCGGLFRTPACCQRYFRDNWIRAVKDLNGDLARLHYGPDSFTVTGDLAYTPFSMYFGFGLCWHFPCNKKCLGTRRMVDQRIRVLRKYPALLKSLMKMNDSELSFVPGEGYKLKAKRGH